MDLSLCVSTFRRPELLDKLLHALGRHDFGGATVELVLVDNDPAGSGLPVAERHRESLPFPMVVRRVAEPNIALARNAAVEVAQGEFLLIIDDDEWPEDEWALALLETQRRYDADAVLGPVLPHYADGVPAWIREADLFAPREMTTGERVPWNRTYTSNVLIRRSALDGVAGPFDPDFGITGGSDGMLFWDLEQRGATVVWCAEAAVSENVPVSRAQVSWLLERSYSGGQNYARCHAAHRRGWPRARARLELLVGSLLRLPVALAMVLVTLPRDRVRAFSWLRRLVAYAGQVTGVAGRQFGHYRF
ncbi:MAG: glycosyltransferase family 2 protein [Nocardioides sp.]|uniref:glycosyltransferase family 2 protein n=1 Tax=Nocardioides sp. TaxID=35761 RepID=UPI0039E58442